MYSCVIFIVGSTGKGFRAAFIFTDIRPLSRVGSHVDFTDVGRCE